MFEIDIEWQEQDEVRDPVLRQTWGTLRIKVNDDPVTSYANRLSRAIQEGPYVSAFPLAKFLISNWWRLTNEPLANDLMLSPPGMRSVGTAAEPWLRAHNLFYSREGMAYPDLTLYGVDHRVGFKYTKWTSPQLSGSFLVEGSALVPAEQVTQELSRFVDQVCLRLDDLPSEIRSTREVTEVLERWRFISNCNESELKLGRRLAQFGIEPFEESVTEEMENALSNLSLDESLIGDLLSAIPENVDGVAQAASDARQLDRALARVPAAGPGFSALRKHAGEARAELDSALPYQAGYTRARWLRANLGLSPNDRVSEMSQLFGRLDHLSMPLEIGEDGGAIRGATDTLGRAVLRMGNTTRVEERRFLEGRALHHLLFSATDEDPKRLITNARDWEQAASRAFSAEMLAPMEAIDFDDAEESPGSLAEQAARFVVSEKVIFHQLQNRPYVQ